MRLIRYCRNLFAIIILAVICGCAKNHEMPAKGGDEINSEEVFSVALHIIIKKYLKKITPKQLVLSGLKTLNSMDSSIEFKLKNEELALILDNNLVSTWTIKNDAPIDKYALILSKAIKSSKSISSKLGALNEKLIQKQILKKFISELDKFSRYAGPMAAKENQKKRNGIIGIGIDFIVKDNRMKITNVITDSPAFNEKLNIGDQITHINGISVEGLSHNAILNQLDGPIMTDVIFEVIREHPRDSLIMQITRERITANSVFEDHEENILYFKINYFNENTSASLLKKITKVLEKTSSKSIGIIIDVRGNPGGLLKQSVKVANMFLEHGKIVSTKGRHPQSIHEYNASGSDILKGLPMIVLIDGLSASASEIFAASLQDQNRAIIVGTSSFGKGTVQTVEKLPNNGEIILTWSQFVAPSGYYIQGLGVRPTICISDTNFSLTETLERTLVAKETIRQTLRLWRSIKPKLPDPNLRETCPAKKQASSYGVEIARHIIKSPDKYNQLLNISAEK